MFEWSSNFDGFANDYCKFLHFLYVNGIGHKRNYPNLCKRIFTRQIFRFDWAHMFSFKSIFHWPWTPDADRIIRNGRSMEMLATALIIYTLCYAVQRAFNFLLYERYILNSVQQFIDICSMSNISMFIFAIDSYGYYIHGR